MIDVLIHSPFPRQNSQGNSVSADRMKQMLSSVGFDVEVEEEWYGGAEARCLIALNARRSTGAVLEFRDACPDGQVVLVLTGTDINHPEMQNESSGTRQALNDADRLVLLHEASLLAVPGDLHTKCEVIYPSVILPEELKWEPSENSGFEMVMAGNVRVEKNVPLVIEACKLLPDDSPIVVNVYGDADPEFAGMMLAATADVPAFQWRGTRLCHS